jgi:peptidoglycan/xylan/chitin deacetylase (PgdA/CDA1 family)
MTWGLSFDDGPAPYTTDLVNYLAEYNIKSTFFIVGSRAISRPDILQAEFMAGHQLSVHTWSHPYLTTLSTESIIAELGWTKKALADITGLTPNTMRPPYGDIDDRVRAICAAMGLTPIIWTSANGQTFDTEDWHIAAGTVSAPQVLYEFENILQMAPNLDTGFIVLSHDLYEQSVNLAIGYYLPDVIARGNFKLEPIISCLQKPLSDAYIETNNNATNPPSDGATTLTPGQSGAATGTTPGGTGKSNAGVALGQVGSNGGLAGFAVSVMGIVLGAGIIA